MILSFNGLIYHKKIMHSILGHEKIESSLSKAIIRNKVFPVWIFSGSFGIGKSSVAYKFAKCLLSGTVPEDGTLHVDQENPIHKLVDSRTHPDFFVLEQSDESVSIDDTRELFSKLTKFPSASKWRIVILENSSNLNKNIYNSLLKITEEPPKNTVIIMICNHIGTIPKTLLSRAAHVNFSSLDVLLVKKILDNMNIDNSEKLAELSFGSVGYALYLNDNNGIEIYNKILEGFLDRSSCMKTLKYIIDNNLCCNFRIIKASLLTILKIYVDVLIDTVDKGLKKEVEILRHVADAKKNFVDSEIKKIVSIIYMINICEPMALDKNAVVINALERFFD